MAGDAAGGVQAEQTARCPACGARIAPDIDWCPRCYTPRTVAAPGGDRSGPPPVASADGPDAAQVTDSADPVTDPSAERQAEQLLADLSAQTPPALGAWSTRLASTPVRVAVMIGGVILVAGLLVGLMALIGLFLPSGG